MRTTAVNDVSIDIKQGEVALMMGPSGSGKTTLLAILSGLLKPDAGKVTALGQDMWALTEREREHFRLKHCSFIFQGYNLFSSLTARQQLEIVAQWGDGASSREARKKAEAELKKLKLMSPMSAEATVVRNYIDVLTGLPNRAFLSDLLHQALDFSRQENIPLAVCMLDLDGFKAVNDTLGHKAGDQVLKSSAMLLKGATRNVDHVARLGGDEFAIIVARCNIQLLKNIAERIIESFACDKLLVRIRQNHGLSVTCSIGAAMYPLHGTSIAQLLEVSDEQMYQAKKAGKNCYRIDGVPQQAVRSELIKA